MCGNSLKCVPMCTYSMNLANSNNVFQVITIMYIQNVKFTPLPFSPRN